jgi:signal peptidase I
MTSTPDQTPAHSAIAKPRRRIWRRLWAGFLSLIAPGLGQAFNREYKRGAIVGFAVAGGALGVISLIKLSVLVWRASPSLTYAILVVGMIASFALTIGAAIDAFRRSNRETNSPVGWLKRCAIYLAFIVAWQLPIELAKAIPGLRPFSVPSVSMLPTLVVGDYFFVVGSYYHLHPPARGDSVVFKLPCDYSRLDPKMAALYQAHCDTSTDFIKRIVGLPGDRVQMRNGILYLNDAAVKREQIEDFSYSQFEDGRNPIAYDQFFETMPNGVRYRTIKMSGGIRPLDNTPEFAVPPDHYFVLGDNRDNSADSRDPVSGIGFVPADYLVGPATFVFFSLDHGQRVDAARQWLPVIRWERLGLALD